MKKDLKAQDMVTINDGEYAGSWGIVKKVGKGKVAVFVQGDGNGAVVKFPPAELTRIPAIELDADAIRALVRFETTIQEICKDQPHPNFRAAGYYQMTLEDLEAALENAIARDDEDATAGWYWTTFEALYVRAGIWECIDAPDQEGAIEGMPDRCSVFADVRDELAERYEYESEEAAPLPQLLEYIRTFKRDAEKPAIERELTDDQKRHFLQTWTNSRVSLLGTPEVEALYVKYVRELSAEDDPAGLEELAYACYGTGNAGFSEDWETSRDCLLKLEEIAARSHFADTLGYIYYYGRCTGGQPEYEKAFYWFSVAAAGGVYEARYKLADMIRDGKGCVKDPEIAAHAIWDLYHENVEYFSRGWGRSKFADIALRAGHVWRDGVNCQKDPNEAYAYYLMAKLAIRMRRQCSDAYGDESVERNINQALASVLPDTRCAEPVEVAEFAELNGLLRFATGYGRRVRMDYKRGKKGHLKLTFRMEDRPGTKYPSKVPVLIPEAQFCGLLEKLVVRAELPEDAKTFGLPGKKGSVVFDEVGAKWPERGSLLLYGSPVARIPGRFKVDCRRLTGKSRRYVSVSFGDPSRTWDYLCDDESVQEGSTVRVPWGKTERDGTVARVTERFDSEVELWRNAYKRVAEKL